MGLRPTVIGGGAPPAEPAAAGAPAPAPLRPTVIGGALPSPSPSPVPTSTSTSTSTTPTPTPTPLPSGLPVQPPPVAPGAEPAATPPAKPVPRATAMAPTVAAIPAPARAPAGATKVHGVERQALRVDTAELRLRHPAASVAAIDHAAALLSAVVPATHPVLALETLGRTPQQGVTRLIERVLAITDDDLGRGSARHVQRLLEMLAELADLLRPAGGLPWRRKTLRQALAEARPELDTLRGLLEQAEAGLAEQRRRLDALDDEARALLDQLHGTLVAVAELRPVFTDARRGQALDGREIDLAKSIALLDSHGLQMQRLGTDLGQLAQRIRDAVLHALPAWLAVAAALPHDSPNDTERFTLLESLHALMQRLGARS